MSHTESFKSKICHSRTKKAKMRVFVSSLLSIDFLIRFKEKKRQKTLEKEYKSFYKSKCYGFHQIIYQVKFQK